jgi:hypothetical protein
MVSFSLKNVSEFSPLSTRTILPHPIPLQGNTCTKPAAPETAKTLRDIKMIDVKRDEGVDDPEDTVLAGSARKQSWVTGIQTAGPNALRDSEYHGYSAHWGHKDNGSILPYVGYFANYY